MGGPDTTGAWHADGALLAAYHDQRLDAAARWSVEAHLTSCAACRLQAGALVDPARLRRLRAALIDTVDLPRAGAAERLLVRLGVADHTARLLAATPALRGSWLLAVASVLAFAVLAGWAHPGQDANLAFLCALIIGALLTVLYYDLRIRREGYPGRGTVLGVEPTGRTRRDLREVESMNAFFIIPTNVKSAFGELFATHPPLEKRLAAVERG